MLKDPAIVAKFDAIGAITVGGTPADLGQFMKTQSTRWAKVIKEANVKIE